MQAFAPGSLTAVFAPAENGGGSRGVSIAIEDGVRATAESSTETTIYLDGVRTEFEPVSLVLEELAVSATVSLDASIPVGSGFGASGAATLASALAANETFDLGFDREQLLMASHRAEVAAGTGLGDVFIQDVGGLAYDLGDGRERVECDVAVRYRSFGGIETTSVLGEKASMERVNREGTAALADLASLAAESTLTLDAVLDRSWTFAERVGLATDRVTETVRRVEAAGGTATMAMVGETVFGIGGESVLPSETRVSETGARLLGS